MLARVAGHTCTAQYWPWTVSIPDSTEMTANDDLWSFIRRPTCVPFKILLPRIENSLLSPQEATKELPRGRRCKTTVNPKDDGPTGESAYLVSRWVQSPWHGWAPCTSPPAASQCAASTIRVVKTTGKIRVIGWLHRLIFRLIGRKLEDWTPTNTLK